MRMTPADYSQLAEMADSRGTAVVIDIPGSAAAQAAVDAGLALLCVRPTGACKKFPRHLLDPSLVSAISNRKVRFLSWIAGDEPANVIVNGNSSVGSSPYANCFETDLKIRRADQELCSVRRISWLHFCDSGGDTLISAIAGSQGLIIAHSPILSVDFGSLPLACHRTVNARINEAIPAHYSVANHGTWLTAIPETLEAQRVEAKKKSTPIKHKVPIEHLAVSGLVKTDSGHKLDGGWVFGSTVSILLPCPLYVGRITVRINHSNLVCSPVRAFLNAKVADICHESGAVTVTFDAVLPAADSFTVLTLAFPSRVNSQEKMMQIKDIEVISQSIHASIPHA